MTKTYGVMFKPEMVRAYIEQRKNQTRRLKGLDVINADPDAWHLMGILDWKQNSWPAYAIFQNKANRKLFQSVRLPYGDTTCTLWIKETWRELIDLTPGVSGSHNYIDYKADHLTYVLPDLNSDVKWISSMLMPHEYSRFTDIPILKVRVERLHAIDNHDAWREGIPEFGKWIKNEGAARDEYARLWDQINGKKYPWALNPWVFVYTFKRYRTEETS